ncbi:MAG: propionyl-CoA synthetase, partial [Granulosicoccus sp.]
MSYHNIYQNSLQNPEAFWKQQAENLDWFTFPKSILSYNEEGLSEWYKGGKLNTSYLALDYHVEQGRGE